jgi:hypothetical protein
MLHSDKALMYFVGAARTIATEHPDGVGPLGAPS